jgi:NitT/TauT family transport system ATP-binding protein
MSTALHIAIEGKRFAESGADGAQKQVIGALEFGVAAGEFVCICGPSGCGKTTLLNIIAGLDTDYSGTVRFGDHQALDAVELGYVFQNPRLLPWRTVEENIRLACPPEDYDPALVAELMDVAGLTGERLSYPEKLSVGMSRRAALVRAFATRPGVLLMDEPFVSLDAPTAERLRQLLLDIWARRRTTVLFVTHDTHEAVELADRILLLSKSPTTLRHEVPVTLPREERDGAQVERFRREHLLVRLDEESQSSLGGRCA